MSTTQQEHDRSNASPSLIWRRRFRELATSLRAIQRGDVSPSTIHKLRIACRRADAVLRLGRERAESRSWKWLRSHLRDLRRSTNALRDDDVLRKWLEESESSSSRLQRRLKQDRRSHIKRVVPRVKFLLSRERFARRARRIHKSLKTLDFESEFATVFGGGLFRELSRFIEAIPATGQGSGRLHETRIACKRLRYAIETIAEIRPTVDLGELNELLKLLQKQLGSIHDGIVRRRRLNEFGPKHTKMIDAKFPKSERDDKLQSFRTWWQALPLERILADATAEIVSFMRMGQLDSP